MGKDDNQDIIEQMIRDKEGLINQASDMKLQISELEKKLLMVLGAQKYISQNLDRFNVKE